MSHFARIENSKVVQVIAISQEEVNKREGVWVETSKEKVNNSKGKYAGIEDEYDSQTEKFRRVNPFPDSWAWNEQINNWEAPKDMPLDSQLYKWNESKQIWEI